MTRIATHALAVGNEVSFVMIGMPVTRTVTASNIDILTYLFAGPSGVPFTFAARTQLPVRAS